MAIQSRRGVYEKLDPQKLLPGEWAVVISGDVNAADGLACYMCFKAGTVKRMATYEDMVDNIADSSGDVVAAEIDRQCKAILEACKTATSTATEAAGGAKTATEAAALAKTAADEAAARATKAAEDCEGLTDNTRVTALEDTMEQVITVLNNALITTA